MLLPKRERVSLMYQLGMAYVQVQDPEDARRCWQYVVEQTPQNARIWQLLFELAVDHLDQAGMDSVVKSLGDSQSFGPQDALYKYCAAWALLTKVRIAVRKDKHPLTTEEHKQLADARRLTDEALLSRAEWGSLWRLRGEIEQESGDISNAISSYQKALQYNRTGQTSVAQRLVQLLYAEKRYSEASEALKLAGDFDATDRGKQMVEDIVFMKGDATLALKMAKEDVDGDPGNAMKQVWYGKLLERNSNSEEAEQAYHKAVEADPKMAMAWELYVRRLMVNQRRSEAVEAVHKAAKSLEVRPGSAGTALRTRGRPRARRGLIQTEPGKASRRPTCIAAARGVLFQQLASRQGHAVSRQDDRAVVQIGESGRGRPIGPRPPLQGPSVGCDGRL